MAEKGSIAIKIGNVTGTLNYERDSNDRLVVVRLTSLVVNNERKKTKKESSFQVSYSVQIDGQSIWSHGASWNNNDKTTAQIKEQKALGRSDPDYTYKIRFEASHGGTVVVKEVTHTVKAYADKYLTPEKTVTGLTLTRDGNKFTAKWKVPSNAVQSSLINRFNQLMIKWRLYKDGSNYTDKDVPKNEQTTSNSQTYGEFKSGLTRKSFYPVTDVKVQGVKVWVIGQHVRADGKTVLNGPAAGPETYEFKTPLKPSVEVSYNKDTSDVTFKIKRDEGKDAHESYWTSYSVVVYDPNGAGSLSVVPVASGTATDLEKTVTVRLSPYMGNLTAGKSVKAELQCKACGIAGDSGTVSASYTVGKPAMATIGTITCDKKGAGGTVKVPVKAGAFTKTMKLQRRHGDGAWEDVQGASTDDRDCQALYDTYQDAAPNAGEYVYYQVISSCDQLSTDSEDKRADCLYTAIVDTECIATLPAPVVIPSADGDSATVNMTWKDSTDNDGTELSWSHERNAWKSGSGPSTETFAWGDASGSMAATITGLDADRACWVQHRRYRDKGGTRYFSSYSDAVKFGGDTAEDDTCGVISVTSNAQGTAATVVVGYTEDTANDGTELSWSTDEGAWGKSSGSISRHEYTEAGSACPMRNWDKQVSLTVADLDPGTAYWVRARRYNESGTKTYTDYSDAAKVVTETAEDDTCSMTRYEGDPSGTGARLYFSVSAGTAVSGINIEWSADSDAWSSNVGPSSADIAVSSAPYRMHLRELQPNTQYTARARTYVVSDGKTTYGEWSRFFNFKTLNVNDATSANDRCGIVSAVVDEGGTGATVVVGWTEDNANDGTEVSWSDDIGAWWSNEGPSTMQATWADEQSKSPSWVSTQTVYLRGLSLGTCYHIKARRYLSSDNSYSPYCKAVSIRTPSSKDDPDIRCGLVSLDVVDGDTAKVVVGWSGDRTGCEVSWSDDPNAWESSDGPKAKEFDWADEFNQSGFKTADTAVDPSKTYYTRSGDEGEYRYEKVASPTASGLADYYELAWSQTGTMYVNGLEEGVTQYVKARSYYESDGRSWSGYSEAMTVTAIDAPASVSLSAPMAVARGESIEAYWTVESDVQQKEWHMHLVGHPNTSIAEGEGSLCHASIPPSRYGDASSVEFYVDAGCGGALTRSNTVAVMIAEKPSLEVACAATLASQPATFDAYTDDPAATLLVTCRSRGVTFQGPGGMGQQLAGDTVWTGPVSPEWEETTWGSTMLRQQLSDAVSDAQDALSDAQDAFSELTDGTGYAEAKADLDAAQAALDSLPAGAPDEDVQAATQARDAAQAALDAVTSQIDGFADALAARDNAATSLSDAQAALAAHPSGGTAYRAACAIPGGLALVDKGVYDIAAQAVEQVAGLRSDAVQCAFGVDWSHQAPIPSDDIEIEVDEAARSVEIALPEPDGWAEGDTYEVYRMTPSGHAIALGGIPAGRTVVDPYAPFGSAHYRIAVRTADGDTAFDDFEYELDARTLRFDWGDEHVELPFNVEVSDAYEKSFEARDHVDGSVNGYYDLAVRKTGSYKAAVRKADSGTVTALRKLGEHPGAVFCRLASGGAFQCNADLGGLDYSYASASAGVTFPITEMKLTQQFMARIKEDE